MFKCFKFIDDKLKQFNEADEIPTQDDDTDTVKDKAPTKNDDEKKEIINEPTSDPSQIANPEQGQFVSNLGDAEYASIMIRALASNPSFKDKIPQEFLNAQTTENAQQIIQFCKNLLGLHQSGGETGFNNMTDEEILSMPA